MKLIRFGPSGQERPGLQLDDGTRVDASGFGEDYDERFFGGGGLHRLRDWAGREASRAPRVTDGVRLGPPVGRPSKIVCIGLNYRDHAPKAAWPFRRSRSSSSRPRPPSSVRPTTC
jgi:2-keto-4-pentenoate hydratase/2-oxohepta-3-ene-1,7-dioic acid hydratase (catechol pathway)